MSLSTVNLASASSSPRVQRRLDFQLSKACNHEIISQLIKRLIGNAEKNREIKALRAATKEHQNFVSEFIELEIRLRQDSEELQKIKVSIERIREDEDSDNLLDEIISTLGTTLANLSAPEKSLTVSLGESAVFIIPGYVYLARSEGQESISTDHKLSLKRSKNNLVTKEPSFTVMDTEWFLSCQSLTQILQAEEGQQAKKEEEAIKALLLDLLDNEQKVKELKKICLIAYQILTSCQEEKKKILEAINEKKHEKKTSTPVKEKSVKTCSSPSTPRVKQKRSSDSVDSVSASSSSEVAEDSIKKEGGRIPRKTRKKSGPQEN